MDLLGTKTQGALVAPSQFFFGLEKNNGQSRIVPTLHTEDGKYVTNSNDIRRYATSFYKDLYTSDYRENKELLAVFHEGLPKVSPEDNAALEGLLVLEELQVALNSMAPGIDGLPVEFDKFFWQELGEDLLEVLNKSCREMCLDQEQAFDRVEHQYLWKTLEA